MTNKDFDILFKKEIIPALVKMRESGGQEYARTDDNIFANFERIANSLDITVEECIMVYAMKHLDGITAHIQGHTSQREDVRGRITDLMVYMSLLWAYLVGDEVEKIKRKAHIDEIEDKVYSELSTSKHKMIEKEKEFTEKYMTGLPGLDKGKVVENGSRINYSVGTPMPEWDGDIYNMPDDIQVNTYVGKKTSKNIEDIPKEPLNANTKGCCGKKRRVKKPEKSTKV